MNDPTLVIQPDYDKCPEVTSPFYHLFSQKRLQKRANKYFCIVIIDTGMDCDLVPRGIPYYCADTCALAAYYGRNNMFMPCSSLFSPDHFTPMFFKAGLEQTSCIHNQQNLTWTWLSFLHGNPWNKRPISCFCGLKVFSCWKHNWWCEGFVAACQTWILTAWSVLHVLASWYIQGFVDQADVQQVSCRAHAKSLCLS